MAAAGGGASLPRLLPDGGPVGASDRPDQGGLHAAQLLLVDDVSGRDVPFPRVRLLGAELPQRGECGDHLHVSRWVLRGEAGRDGGALRQTAQHIIIPRKTKR